MDLVLFSKSVVLGVAIAAPLGPIGALCINRTLQHGFRAGFAGGFGTALGDAFYASVAALCSSAFSMTLTTFETHLKLVGGLLMLALGWRGVFGHPGAKMAQANGVRGLSSVMLVTFLLTISNPMTVFVFLAVFAGLGFFTTPGLASAALIVAGVFTGSLLWWLALTSGVSAARRYLPESLVKGISRASGVLLLLFGAWALGSAFWR